mmetsp:Transcript_60949/g.170480  ORF Transcript_60949/g.170480 Transcript_60949/m.170480 type:complete len:339 (+) Transcript_60949:1430-2446(+)
MSAVALIASKICCRRSSCSARMWRKCTSSFSRRSRILASCSIFDCSIAFKTSISARFSSDWSLNKRSSFSPFCLACSCRMFESSCSFMSSMSAAFFWANSCATRSWWSFELCSWLFRCSSSLIWIVFCSSSHRNFSMLRFTNCTSKSASLFFRCSTRSARASLSTAARNSSMNLAMLTSCASVLFRTSSRPCCSALRPSSWRALNLVMSASIRTTPCSVLVSACCIISTFAMTRTICSSSSSRFRLLSFCSWMTWTISFSSFSMASSQWSAFFASSCKAPKAANNIWLSRSIMTFLVTLDMPFAFVQRRSGRSATALGIVLWISCVMTPSCRLEKNLL